MSLNDFRQKLDEIDSKILPLLEERMTYSRFVGEYKKSRGIPILNEAREQEILRNVRANTADESLKDYTEKIYKEIMRISRECQVEVINK